MSTLWGVVSSLTSLFYAGMQVMVPCLPPAPLSTAVINTDEVRALQFLIIYECVCVCVCVYIYIKSNHSLVSEILESVLQTVQKQFRQCILTDLYR